MEIVPDSFSRGAPVAVTAASDEPHLMESCELCLPEGSITSSSCPVRDRDTNYLACSIFMPAIPVPASIDDALAAQPDSTCEVQSTCSEKRYPTRTTRGLPSCFKDYASINSSGAHPHPSGGGALASFITTQGLCISIPLGDPRAFNTRVFERWMSLSGRTGPLSQTGLSVRD